MQTNRIDDQAETQGTLEVYVHRASDNALLQHWQQPNRVPISGLNLIRDLMACQPDATGLSHYAVGTGTTPTQASDTALESEVYRYNITKFERSNGTLRAYFYLQSGAANDSLITEVGEFGNNGETLYARAVLAQTIDKTEDVTVTFVHTNAWEAV